MSHISEYCDCSLRVERWNGALRNISANTVPPFACDSPFDGAADTSAHLQLQHIATPAQQWLTCSLCSNSLCSLKAEDVTERNLMSAPLRKKEILQVFGCPRSRAAVPAVTGQRCGHWTFLVLFKWQEKVGLDITDPWFVSSGVTEIPQQSQNELSKNDFSLRWMGLKCHICHFVEPNFWSTEDPEDSSSFLCRLSLSLGSHVKTMITIKQKKHP